jgi:hypothetical protein
MATMSSLPASASGCRVVTLILGICALSGSARYCEPIALSTSITATYLHSIA